MMPSLRYTLPAILMLGLASCQQETPAPEAPPATGLTRLPVSTNALMVGLVDHSADYIFAVGNGDLPRDDHDWDQVRSSVYDMILAGAIMKVPGTGENDAGWVANEDWQAWSDDLTAIGNDALLLADAKSTDTEAWMAIGNRLTTNCDDCHQSYKPEIPSQGILHEATIRESRGESIFD